ncbi:hypothetical protein DFR52_101493 [Hoeflea marina]|uniref:Uncharacterized protein n=1 Tax=Hoeflea marina TaxID=274592 RepID=A0A317PSS4_9HYPH|nr:hypothetical protein DFR52_101493 [Hoeflea marina]
MTGQAVTTLSGRSDGRMGRTLPPRAASIASSPAGDDIGTAAHGPGIARRPFHAGISA